MKRQIKVYGERNTNTNYLSKLLQLNLDVSELPGVAPFYVLWLQNVVVGNEWVIDLYFRLTYARNLGWKHMRAKAPAELNTYATVRRSVCCVTLTKNPYSWLLSLHRRPYHQYDQTKRTFETFLCTPWKTVARENCATVLRSPIELWNLKNDSYRRLATLGALTITTESLFENPGAAIEAIARTCGVRRKSSSFINWDASTSEQGKGTSYYRDYYLSERWRESLSKDAIAIINASLDKGLMDHFGYEVLL